MKMWKETVTVGGRRLLGGTAIDMSNAKQSAYANAHPEVVTEGPKEKSAPAPAGGESK